MTRIAYFNGTFVPETQVMIPYRDRSFNRGDGCFDMTRTFDGRIFRIEEHVERLYRSLRYLRIDIGLEPKEVVAISEEVVQRNEALRAAAGDWWVAQRVSRGVDAIGDEGWAHTGPQLIVDCTPLPLKARAAQFRDGIDVVIPSVRRIPLETPFIIDHHMGLSARREGPGVMIGFGRKDEASSFDTRPDWELVPAVAERLVQRIPAMADAPIVRAWAGLYEMTPDQMGIISRVPEVAGLHVLAGFSGHGFMHGPIAGQLMAELVADGRAHTVDIAPLDIERFKRAQVSVEVMTFV